MSLITPKFIDGATLTKPQIKDIKFSDLLADCVARENEDAYKFLATALKEKVKVVRKGKDIYVPRLLASYRLEYLEKFCGYVNKSKKKINNNDLLLEEARRLLDAKKGEA